MEISQSSIEEVLDLQHHIPEFVDSYTIEEYQKRLRSNHLILIAKVNNIAIGFKVGYQLDKSTFYSWMGGVTPSHRGMGVAQKLADYQLRWAKEKGYKAIRFKTRNYLKPMLIFAMKNSFDIIDIDKKNHSPSNYRIILEKNI